MGFLAGLTVLVLLLVAVVLLRKEPPQLAPVASAGADSAIDVEAYELAAAIRVLYPFARAAEKAAEDDGKCLKGKGAKALCATDYFNRLADIRERLVKVPVRAGCPTALASGIAGAIDMAIKEDSKNPKQEPLGVRFGSVHDSYRVCTGRLFQTKVGTTFLGPPTPAAAGTFLGVRDDSQLPGPIRAGLFTATGKPINEAALAPFR